MKLTICLVTKGRKDYLSEALTSYEKFIETADVNVILSANCGINNSCHGASNTSGYNLSNYAGVKSVGQTGQLYGAIAQTQAYIAMPQGGGKLSACNIAKVKRWIDNGYAQ